MKKIFYSSYTRLFIGFILVSVIVVSIQLSSVSILAKTQINKDYKDVITSIAAAAAALISYITLFHYYERRHVNEIGISSFGKNAGIGLMTGLILQSLVILVIFSFGSYSVLKVNPISYVLPGFAIAFSSAIFEEILFRGILFRLLEEKLGSIIALTISASIFGLMHLANKNSNLYSALSVAVQAGVLLGASFIYSKNLWLPIALHFGWNFAESGIYGAIISGAQISKSLFTAKFVGVTLVTGGAFGPENSLQATIFCLAAAIIFLSLSKKGNKFIRPSWKEKKEYTVVKEAQ